ncbi:YTH domain-containing protein ECT4 isoform X2 [Aegilops tauschii subsp. strangulata]|uniref:YTH domain-containing protein ECT4 isoform X2 n=1 Tax=Aegilops tauschii subsp. strangulata TaxID=200361 RepID=UPI00098A3BCA|nr:YTH domain-containing protein ECT1 isoform X2 [Aegilops tauschii subsp. strangulata]
MAAAAAAADQATNLLQKLSLDAKAEAIDAPAAKEKASGGLGGKLNGVAATGKPRAAEQWANPQDYSDASMYYGAYPAAYYCAGWGDYSMYLNQDGVETPTAGAYGDMYCYPQYGHDGQMYGSQQYQYPSSYHQPQNTASKPQYKSKTDKLAPSMDISSTVADPLHAVASAPKATANSVDEVKGLKKTSTPLNPSGNNGSYLNQSSRPAYPWYGGQIYQGKQQKPSSGNPTSTDSNPKSKVQSKNQNTQPLPPLMSLPNSPVASMYAANGMYNSNAYGGFWYGSQFYGPGMYGGWNNLSDGKYKPRGRTAYGSYGFPNENLDGLNELKRGPRSGLSNNQQGFGPAAATAVKAQDVSATDGSNAVVQDQYNGSDLADTYENAKFFIIKSYSEDDVHKSIKYNVWASTPNGNKKLDSTYLEAKSVNSPVFLLFSVNTSGQFVGLAEMVGQVDFDKTVEHWQQDKWTGCFPVKWHIVKDIPNNLLKHIILEYNENKPVTNSRDTQEVKLEQGLQVLKIFKDHVSKTSILDDFSFYDNREKIMQERKSQRQLQLKKESQKPEVTGENKSAVEDNVEAAAVSGVAPKDANPTAASLAVANGC